MLTTPPVIFHCGCNLIFCLSSFPIVTFGDFLKDHLWLLTLFNWERCFTVNEDWVVKLILEIVIDVYDWFSIRGRTDVRNNVCLHLIDEEHIGMSHFEAIPRVFNRIQQISQRLISNWRKSLMGPSIHKSRVNYVAPGKE